VSRVLRWLLLSKGNISRADAAEIARAECARRAIPWVGSCECASPLWRLGVWTFADHRGGNVRVIVDRGAGEVKMVVGPTAR